MAAQVFDNAWFISHRDRLLDPPHHGTRYTNITRSLLDQSRLDGAIPPFTEGAIGHLAPRHAAAVRAHMQFYRASLEAIGLVPSDAIVNAAVQLEWLWYTTPFKPFYRDHLAHVLKVALTGLCLLKDEEGPLAVSDQPLIDRIASELTRGEMGSKAIHAAARWCGNSQLDEAFWKAAVLEAVRIAGLLHDMAYPDVMSVKVGRAAHPVRVQSPYELTDQELSQRAVSSMAHHLVMTPFNQGRLAGPLPLAADSQRVAGLVFRDSHSLRGAHTLLRFMETTHRASSLQPFDVFVLEWAALAVSLHDYDKFFEKADGEIADWLGRSENREAIRPCFRDDPVSYIVALADQLQDFGRMHYTPEPRNREAALSGSDVAPLWIRYPCEAVQLEANGPPDARIGTVRFVFGAEERIPFGLTRKDAETAAGKKVPQDKPELTFGPKGWLKHKGLFERVEVEVIHGETLLASTKPPESSGAEVSTA